MVVQRYLAIGDIHGCWRELDQLMELLGQKYDLSDPQNKVVFLGDYIDRGESSYMVLQRLLELQEKFPHFEFLMGNHELMYLQSPGELAEVNDLPARLPNEMLNFLRGLKPYLITDEYLFVHGGPSGPDNDLEKVGTEQLLWNYSPTNKGWRGRTIVRGHRAVDEVEKFGSLISVDTGCCFGNKLSCAILSGGKRQLKTVSVPKFSPASHDEIDHQLGSIARGLADAYRKTSYQVMVADSKFILRIGEANPELDYLLARECVDEATFITAFNLFSQAFDARENLRLLAELEQKVRDIGRKFYPGVGIPDASDWSPEKSILVLGMNLVDAIDLGQQFSQNAIVYHKRGDRPKLYWCRIPHDD